MSVIIDTGVANIASVVAALKRLGHAPTVTQDAQLIEKASHVIFPGVGTAKAAMQRLKALRLDVVIPALSQPVLGICLGMQLLFDATQEGDVQGLSVVPGKIQKIQPQDGITVPHMGWNTLEQMNEKSPLLAKIDEGSFVYFVHSYAAPETADSVALTRHGSPFTSAVQRANFFGVQFHPERSGAVGMHILQNFLAL